MGSHAVANLGEIGDKLAIRELIEAYAHCADRREVEGQMALFTDDTTFIVYMDSRAQEPSYTLNGREALRPIFENLRGYDTTTHFLGQSTLKVEGDAAMGESYCLAHHLSVVDGHRTMMVASIRYLDEYARQQGRWLFAKRTLLVDWIETRISKI